MTDKLTDNDKQRIEQASLLYSGSHNLSSHLFNGFIKGAEYATIYEREQQANGLKSIENPDHHIKVLKEQIQRMEKEYKQLEAERSEVVSLLKEYANDTGAVDTNLKARVKMYLAEHKL